MIKIKKTANKKIIFGFLCLSALLSSPFSFAQKSSGVLDDSDIKSYTDGVESIDDSVTRRAYATGNAVRFLLRPIREADISVSMTGIVAKMHFNVGQRFKKGDVLVSMRCGSVNAQLEAQRARVKQFTLDYQADQQMLEGNAVSRFTAEKSKSSLDEQKALYKEAEINQRNCKVIAPFSGGVVTKEVQAYEAVTPSVIVMSIIDDSGLVMSLNVPSSYVNRVKPQDKFTVIVDETGKSYAAKVVGVSPAIDPVSKTIELRAEITEGLEELVSGMSGRANLDFTR